MEETLMEKPTVKKVTPAYRAARKKRNKAAAASRKRNRK